MAAETCQAPVPPLMAPKASLSGIHHRLVRLLVRLLRLLRLGPHNFTNLCEAKLLRKLLLLASFSSKEVTRMNNTCHMALQYLGRIGVNMSQHDNIASCLLKAPHVTLALPAGQQLHTVWLSLSLCQSNPGQSEHR